MPDAQAYRTSAHEAGHAAMAVVLGLDVTWLTREPTVFDGGGRCQTKFRLGDPRTDSAKEMAHDRVCIALAGPLENAEGDISLDLSQLHEWMETAGDSMDDVLERTRALMMTKEYRAAHTLLETALLEKTNLSEADLRAILEPDDNV